MDIASLPFNKHIGIHPCNNPDQGIFEISSDSKYLNHIQSVHASAIFALAEASSGEFLRQQTSSLDQGAFVPTLRRSEIKYRTQGDGRLYGIAKRIDEDWEKLFDALLKKGRAPIVIEINVMNEAAKCVAIAKFEWFIFKKPTNTTN